MPTPSSDEIVRVQASSFKSGTSGVHVDTGPGLIVARQKIAKLATQLSPASTPSAQFTSIITPLAAVLNGNQTCFISQGLSVFNWRKELAELLRTDTCSLRKMLR